MKARRSRARRTQWAARALSPTPRLPARHQTLGASGHARANDNRDAPLRQLCVALRRPKYGPVAAHLASRRDDRPGQASGKCTNAPGRLCAAAALRTPFINMIYFCRRVSATRRARGHLRISARSWRKSGKSRLLTSSNAAAAHARRSHCSAYDVLIEAQPPALRERPL